MLLRSCMARVAYALAMGRQGRPLPIISLEAPWSPYKGFFKMKMRRGAKLASSKLFRTRILLQWNSIQALILFPGAMAIFYGLLAPDGMRLQMWGGGGGFVSTLVPDKNVLAWPILRVLLNTINVYLYYCLIWTKYGYQTFYMPKKELQVKKSLKQDETSGEAMA